MASQEVLDFARLLARIPGDSPTGIDLRENTSPTSDYYAVRDARRAASETERRIDKGEETSEPPDWRAVLERTTKVLAEKSKDLEVAAYLIEALVRLKGFPGLRDGYRLSRELVVQFWEGLFPRAQDGEVEDRFSHILSLNGLDGPGPLIVPVRKIPMTAATSLGTFNLTHHQQALQIAKMTDAKQQKRRIDEGAVTLETIQRAIAETPARFYADLIDDIRQSAEEFRRFCTTLSERSGFDPPSSELLGVLDSYLDIVKDLARDKIPKAPAQTGAAAPPAEAASGTVTSNQPAAAVVDPGKIQSRDDAFERLKKIADYFREHEPQSIVPFALEQVANWGKMSLPELMTELITEEGPRKNFFKQIGIKAPESKK
ncbi:MAG: type VI secretion system protein TssA [Planctomycetaceae bacterium]|nr:type VI secretion system protein TssA [Planctomycetaceae bacterium]